MVCFHSVVVVRVSKQGGITEEKVVRDRLAGPQKSELHHVTLCLLIASCCCFLLVCCYAGAFSRFSRIVVFLFYEVWLICCCLSELFKKKK